GDVGRGGAGFLAEPEEERRAAPVDELVRDPGGDDLAAERMAPEPLGKTLRQRRREVERELALQGRVVRQAGAEQVRVERDLGVGEDDRELGRRQAEAR